MCSGPEAGSGGGDGGVVAGGKSGRLHRIQTQVLIWGEETARGREEGDGRGNLMPRRCDNGPLPQEIPARVGRNGKKKKKRKEGRERMGKER